MGFDSAWFDALRNLNEEKINIAKIKGIRGFAPLLQELFGYKLILFNLLNEADYLLREMENTDYVFDPLGFRACDRHIYIFPTGKSFRKQWNIGFFAGEDPSEDYARIGLGFSLNSALSDGKGWDEYLDFVMKIKQRPDDFDRLMREIGYYAEPECFQCCIQRGESLSASILENPPQETVEWRFFGRRVGHDSKDGRDILSSTERFVKEAVWVFDQIFKSGFA